MPKNSKPIKIPDDFTEFTLLHPRLIKILDRLKAPPSWKEDRTLYALWEVAICGLPRLEPRLPNPESRNPELSEMAHRYDAGALRLLPAIVEASREDPSMFGRVLVAFGEQYGPEKGSPEIERAEEIAARFAQGTTTDSVIAKTLTARGIQSTPKQVEHAKKRLRSLAGSRPFPRKRDENSG